METVIAVIARVFVALALLLIAAIIARLLYRVIPDGKLKDVLFKRLS